MKFDANLTLARLRDLASIVHRKFTPYEQDLFSTQFLDLDAAMCNGEPLPADWRRPVAMPAGLQVVTQHWLDLLNERTRLTKAAGGELTYDELRAIEDAQIDAASAVAEAASCWLTVGGTQS